MPVGLLTLEIDLPYSHSLKEKRAVLQKLMGRLRSRFNAAVAELDHQDAWQRSTIAIVTVSASKSVVESSLRKMLEESEKVLGHDVSAHEFAFFE
ncbi:MAG: DUF503 domain-containing protein [Acidobacteriota bacterium]|nr:DUF503 domain-containing protein [Acidobacteriota bacterium]